MIVGAEKITYYLIKRLESFDYKIKVLESDNAKCENLFTQIKGVHIINADGSDPNVLTEEKINDADCFITLTKDDQANVIISLYAERSGVAKVITKLDRPMNITESIGIDTVVSPVISSASHVESYVRALDNSKGFSEIRSIYKLIGGKVEVLEFLIDRECALTRVPVGDLALKQNVMIACIEHHGRIIIPRKGDKIKKSDSVLVLTTRISEFTSPLDIL
jgi:trk system potassium uptake protein TrkA